MYAMYQEPVVMVKDDYVEMEMDELNQHECMATLTALLQHMAHNNISPQPDKACTASLVHNPFLKTHGSLQQLSYP